MHRLVLFHAPFEDPMVGAFLAQNMLQSKEAACVQNVCEEAPTMAAHTVCFSRGCGFSKVSMHIRTGSAELQEHISNLEKRDTSTTEAARQRSFQRRDVGFLVNSSQLWAICLNAGRGEDLHQPPLAFMPCST
jgi:hypothetical protein